MKSITECSFAHALVALSLCLTARDTQGLPGLASPHVPKTLLDLASELTDENVLDTLQKCIGLVNSMMAKDVRIEGDSPDSIEALVLGLLNVTEALQNAVDLSVEGTSDVCIQVRALELARIMEFKVYHLQNRYDSIGMHYAQLN